MGGCSPLGGCVGICVYITTWVLGFAGQRTCLSHIETPAIEISVTVWPITFSDRNNYGSP